MTTCHSNSGQNLIIGMRNKAPVIESVDLVLQYCSIIFILFTKQMVKMVNNLPLELFILGPLEKKVILKGLFVIPFDYTYMHLFKFVL